MHKETHITHSTHACLTHTTHTTCTLQKPISHLNHTHLHTTHNTLHPYHTHHTHAKHLHYTHYMHCALTPSTPMIYTPLTPISIPHRVYKYTTPRNTLSNTTHLVHVLHACPHTTHTYHVHVCSCTHTTIYPHHTLFAGCYHKFLGCYLHSTLWGDFVIWWRTTVIKSKSKQTKQLCQSSKYDPVGQGYTIKLHGWATWYSAWALSLGLIPDWNLWVGGWVLGLSILGSTHPRWFKRVARGHSEW